MVHSIRGMGKRNEHEYKIEMESSAFAIQFSRGIETIGRRIQWGVAVTFAW
jgi:hypothetical protein